MSGGGAVASERRWVRRARGRRIVSQVGLSVALSSGVWTAILLSTQGFDVTLFGLSTRSHAPIRPLVLALIGLAASVAAVGPRRALADAAALVPRAVRTAGRVPAWIGAVLLAAAIFAAGVHWNTRAAGGSDSYGYISEADLWLSGHLTISQPWVAEAPWPNAGWSFAPLAWLPRGIPNPSGAIVEDPDTLVPKVAPGLPLLMALAKAVGGQCVLFCIGPFFGGVLVLGTYGIGRRLASPAAGLAAAWLVATSPAMLYMVVQPMSDVPAAAAWAVAFWCLLHDGTGAALLAGLAAAVAVLVRPNLVPIAAVVGVWLALVAWRAPRECRPAALRRVWAFAAALAPAAGFVALMNWFWYGSPLRSGYEPFDVLFRMSNLPGNAVHYGGWVIATQTPLAALGIAALALPRLWAPRARQQRILVLFAAITVLVWLEYCVFVPVSDWTHLRYLLPTWPLMMTGMAGLLMWPAASGRRLVRVAAGFAAVGVGLYTLHVAADRGAFRLQRSEAKYVAAAALTRARTPANAVLFSLQHSGSLRYYGGRMTLSWISLEPDWLDRSVAWLDAHGAHPYALLEDWEVPRFRQRFGATSEIGRLEMSRRLEYDGATRILLFDLLDPPGEATPLELVQVEPPGDACPEPEPAPQLVLE